MKVKIPVEAANDVAQDLLNLVNDNGAPVELIIRGRTIEFKLNKKKDKLVVKIKGANDNDDEPDRSDDSEFMKDFKEIIRNGIKEVNPDIADEIADNLHYYLERVYGERLKDKELRKDQEVSNQEVCQEGKRRVEIEEAIETFLRPLSKNPLAYIIQYTKANKDKEDYPIFHAYKKFAKKLNLDEVMTIRLKELIKGYRNHLISELYRCYVTEMAKSIGCTYPMPDEKGNINIEALYDLYNLLLAVSKRNENIAKMNQDMIDHVNDTVVTMLHNAFKAVIK